MKLSVVIPIFNEEKTIERIVDEVLGEQTPKEIIIIMTAQLTEHGA